MTTKLRAPSLRDLMPLTIWFLLLADVLLLGWWNWLLPSALLVLLLLLSMAVLLWLTALRRQGTAGLATPLDGGLLLLLAALLLSSSLALDPSRSWRMAWQWLLAVLAFYGAVSAGRAGWPLPTFSKALLLVLALAQLAAYVQLYGWLTRWYAAGPWPDLLPPALPRVWGITNSPNVLAVMLNMGFFFSLAHWRARQGRPPLPLVLWLVAAAPLLLLPASRSGWLGFVAGAAVFGVSGRWARGLKLNLRTLLLSGLGVLTAAGLLWLLMGWLRPTTLQATGSQLDIVFRTRFWTIALDAWAASPLWGSGLNSYATFFLEATPVPFATLFVAAHNIFFQVLADMGLIGLAAVGVIGVGVSRQLWLRRQQPLSVWQRAILASLAAFIVHGLFDTPETWIMFLAAVQLGLLAADWRPEPGAGTAAWRWLWPALAVGLLLTGFIGWRTDQAYFQGQQAAASGDWATAQVTFAEAGAGLPFDDTAIVIAQALSAARRPDGGPVAAALYETILAQEPGWSLHYANLAGLLWAAGESEAALTQMQTAISLAPDVPLYYLNLALWYEASGQLDMAGATYQELAALSDVWLGGPFWSASAPRQAALAAVAPQPVPAPPALADMAAAVAANPYDADAQFELGLAHLRAGEPAAAATAWRRASVLATVLNSIGFTRGRARFVPLWQLALPGADSEAAAAQAAAQGTQSVYGPGRGGAGNYVLTVFVRLPLAVDLVPALRCFSSGSARAGELNALNEWLVASGRAAEAAWIPALLAGDGDGTVACGEGGT